MKDGTVMTLAREWSAGSKTRQRRCAREHLGNLFRFREHQRRLIILGAEEGPKGEVEYVGVPNPKQLVKKFWDGVHNPSKVSANILTDDSITIETINDCDIIRIQVPRANRHLRLSTSAAIGKREPTVEMAREIIAAHPKKSLP